jgi:TctA family transporter
MTIPELLIGVVGTDVNSGVARFTFAFDELSDKVELVALGLAYSGSPTSFATLIECMLWVAAPRCAAICARTGRN